MSICSSVNELKQPVLIYFGLLKLVFLLKLICLRSGPRGFYTMYECITECDAK